MTSWNTNNRSTLPLYGIKTTAPSPTISKKTDCRWRIQNLLLKDSRILLLFRGTSHASEHSNTFSQRWQYHDVVSRECFIYGGRHDLCFERTRRYWATISYLAWSYTGVHSKEAQAYTIEYIPEFQRPRYHSPHAVIRHYVYAYNNAVLSHSTGNNCIIKIALFMYTQGQKILKIEAWNHR